MFTYMINHPLSLLLAFCIFICALIVLLYTSFLKLKRKESQRISRISSELEFEKNISGKLKSVAVQIQKMEHETNQKLLNIRVTILNIHHTLWEIFT